MAVSWDSASAQQTVLAACSFPTDTSNMLGASSPFLFNLLEN
jgi:hypothetical protein